MLGSACAALISKRTASLAAKEAVEKVLKSVAVLTFARRHSPSPASSRSGGGLGSRFGIDVDYARLQLLCHLAKSIRELLRGGNLQLRRIGAIYRFGGTLYTSLNDRADKNSNKQCRDYQNRR